MDPVTWVLLGVIAGGGLVGGGMVLFRPDPDPVEPVVIVPDNSVAEAQQEVVLQLTDLDIVQEPCSTSFIEAYGDGLCREMFCRQLSRGIDSQTSGSECEQISNLNNTTFILKTCAELGDDPDQLEECYQLFRERK